MDIQPGLFGQTAACIAQFVNGGNFDHGLISSS
jgi:hypothetical protein